MRISFDLDDTLICYQKGVPNERRLPWYLRWLGGDEPLRFGARHLIRRLKQRGWEVWIYTTSYRDPLSIRIWLWCHGIWINGVVNQNIHDKHLKNCLNYYPPSKEPSAFGIALRVDDSDGIRMEGEKHGFGVVVVSPDDLRWTEKVWASAQQLANR